MQHDVFLSHASEDAATAGIEAGDSDSAIDALLENMKVALEKIALPPLPEYGPNGKKMTDEMLTIARERVKAFA